MFADEKAKCVWCLTKWKKKTRIYSQFTPYRDSFSEWQKTIAQTFLNNSWQHKRAKWNQRICDKKKKHPLKIPSNFSSKYVSYTTSSTKMAFIPFRLYFKSFSPCFLPRLMRLCHFEFQLFAWIISRENVCQQRTLLTIFKYIAWSTPHYFRHFLSTFIQSCCFLSCPHVAYHAKWKLENTCVFLVSPR